MGCGKSTIGGWLAKRFEAAFIDTDHLIEQIEGCSIAELFASKGEEYFRQLEHKTISELNSEANITIVATGGGAPCHLSNMDTMNSRGLTVYLSNTPKQLARQLEHGKSKRPLIKDLNQEQLEDFIASALEQRNPYYQQAKLIVDCYGCSNEYIANHIKRYIDFSAKK